MKRGATSLAVLALVLVVPVAWASPDEARDWLERMSGALASRNYDGLFTHSSGNKTETMRIVHRSENGQSEERLVSLDGMGREIVRTSQEVHAYMPDRRVVLVEPRTDDGSLLQTLPTPTDRLDSLYELSMQSGTRLLGRETQVVDIRPKDAYRYGYRLWLDAETAMPLRSMVSDTAGRPIEQIQFTRLEMKDRIPDKDIEPAVDATGFQWVRTARHVASAQWPAIVWRPLRMPPGFHLQTTRIQVLPGSPMPAQHLIFSDGIAAVSVFIEPGGTTGPRPPETSSMGSANAYSTSVQGHVITAVGEVPLETVRYFADSVAPVRDQPAPPKAALVSP